MDMLRELPLPQREVVMLIGVLGLDYAAAAESLGVPVGTVRSRLSRARESLGARLEEALAV
jgi:RNA polymerase sigma-70 factor (ECF subfamily)